MMRQIYMKAWIMMTVGIIMLTSSFLPHHHHHHTLCFIYSHNVCDDSGCTTHKSCDESSDSEPCDGHCIVKFEMPFYEKDNLIGKIFYSSQDQIALGYIQSWHEVCRRVTDIYIVFKSQPFKSYLRSLSFSLRAPPCLSI